MSSPGMKASPENAEHSILEPLGVEELLVAEASQQAERERTVARLRLLWERRRFLARVTGVGLALSILIAFLIPVRYTSTVRLMPPDQQSGTGGALLSALTSKAAAGSTAGSAGLGGGLGMLAGDFLGLKNTGELFVGVLHSRTVQDELIGKFNLREEYRDRRWEDARKDLEKRTDVSQDRKSGIITIKAQDRSREQATAMAQEYVAQLNHVVNELSTSGAHRERVFLEGRLKEVKEDLERSENDLSQFSNKNTTLDVKEQGKAMVAAAAGLQGHLIAAESELEGLKQIYTDNNVRVKTAEARVNELRAELEKLGGSDTSAPRRAADGTVSKYPTIGKLALLGVEYADLYRRTKIDEAVFEGLTQECELAKVEEAKDIPSVKVLDSADLPERHSFPPRPLIVVFVTLFSLAAGILWVFQSARWTQTDSNDPAKALAIEVFTTVKTSLPWNSRNGAEGTNGKGGFLRRVLKHEDQ